jgi:alpha-tubulin suppressor-like RCC1 family protein
MLTAALAALTIAPAAAAASGSSGQVMAWGENASGQLGDGKTKTQDKPVAARGLNGVTAISANGNRSVALLSNGTVMEWGSNGSDVPVAVSGLSGVTAISAGEFNLALLGNGTVMQWSGSEAPAAVSSLSGVTAIAAGGDSFGLALLNNGTVKAWGNNLYGELGDGTTEYSATPVPVKELSGVSAISAAVFDGVALLSDGHVMTWGINFNAELGDGITGETTYENTDSDVPVAVCAVGSLSPCPTGPYLSAVTAVSATGAHTLALLNTGAVVAWGHNDAGELGDGTTETPVAPVAVSGLSHVTALAAGGDHSLALLSDGTAMAWGYNVFGQLGDGTRTGPERCDVAEGGGGFACSTVPAAVPSLSGLAGLSAGGEDSLAFRASGLPAVTKVAPAKGSAAGGTTVTVTGTNLTGATAVKFGSTSSAAFTVKSDTQITATSPPESAVGTLDVTVTTLVGTTAISSSDHFKVAPSVTGLSANRGPNSGGTSVTVSGAGFGLGKTATVFKFGAAKAQSVECGSSTQCTAIAPAHAGGAVDVKATVSGVASPKSRPADVFTYE